VSRSTSPERRLGHPCRGLDHRDRRRDRQGPRGSSRGWRRVTVVPQSSAPPALGPIQPRYRSGVGPHLHQHRRAGVDWTPMFAPPTEGDPVVSSSTASTKDDPRPCSARSSRPSPTRPSPTTACTAASRAPSASRASSSTAAARSRRRLAALLQRRHDHPALRRLHADRRLLPRAAAARRHHLAADRGRRPGRVQGRLREARDHVARLVHRALHLRDGAGYGDYLLPYLAREVLGEWRLGANASGIIRPDATDWEPVPLVTPAPSRPAPWRRRSRGPLHVHRRHGQRQARHQQRPGPQVAARREDRRLHRPAAVPLRGNTRAASASHGRPAICCSRSTAGPTTRSSRPPSRRSRSSSADASRAASTAPTCAPSRSTTARPTPRSPTNRCATTASRCASAC
jgi:hypothetical protein